MPVTRILLKSLKFLLRILLKSLKFLLKFP
jgi:hypothetical protein